MEFDLDKALEDVPIHVEDASTSSQTPTTPSQVLPKLEHRTAAGIVELPSEEEKKLQHFTKLRPRRNKKKHSSKIPVSKAEQLRIDSSRYFLDMVPDPLTSPFSKSTVRHLRMGSRTASWEGWTRVWTSSSLQKSPGWTLSEDNAPLRCFSWVTVWILFPLTVLAPNSIYIFHSYVFFNFIYFFPRSVSSQTFQEFRFSRWREEEE